MKKLTVLLAVLAASVGSGVALADTPQGKLTGGALVDAQGPLSGRVEFGAPVIDGGTTFVGRENDLSGNFDGDSGTVKVRLFDDAFHNVVCAHFVLHSGDTGNPKMRFAYQSASGQWTVVRITDNGSPGKNDTIAFGFVTSLADAILWVNLGALGSGRPFTAWGFTTVESGNFNISA